MRTLTVSALYRPRRRGTQLVSHLRLSGQWLATLGFPPGVRVHVVHSVHGELVLKKV